MMGLNIQKFYCIVFQQANKEGILKNANVIKVNGFNRVNSLGWVVWIGNSKNGLLPRMFFRCL